MSTQQGRNRQSLFDPKIMKRAGVDALVKLAPLTMMKNPVMFVVEVGSVLTTVLLVSDSLRHVGHFGFDLQICLPTSPKRWRKDAGRPRRMRCARLRRRLLLIVWARAALKRCRVHSYGRAML